MNNFIKYICCFQLVLLVLLLASCNKPADKVIIDDAYNAFAECNNSGAYKAIKKFNTLLKANPNNSNAYTGLGAAYICLYESDLNQDKLDNAIKNLKKSIEINSKNPETYYYLGCAMAYKKECSKAINFFTHAIKLKPDFVQAYEGRCLCYDKLKEYDKAIQDHIDAVNNSTYQTEWSPGNYIYLAKLYIKKGDFDKAEENCNKAIEINPNFISAYEELGHIYLLNGSFDKGKKVLENVISKNPRSVAYLYLGDAYFERKEYSKAADNYNMFLNKVNPYNSEIKHKLKKLNLLAIKQSNKQP
ncbi:MAG: tetratricopeptide repeat protein [Cyanobacteriota bacterium]